MPFLRRLVFLTLIAALIPFVQPARAASEGLDALAAVKPENWLNAARPVTPDDMKGRLVLLDFWTYGCINCMQIVPDLSCLEDKFGDKLVIIGVHSAKFQNEQGSDRILAAAQRFGLKHPVVNDSDFAVWNAFGVQAWPTLVLLGPDGSEISRYEGEGHRGDLESDIEKNLPRVTATAPASGLAPQVQSTGILSFPARLAVMQVSGKGLALGKAAVALFFVADTGHNRILSFDDSGEIHDVIGSGAPGLKDGKFADAEFNRPRGIAVMDGYLYVADTGSHALRRVDLAAQTVETVAGTGEQGHDRNVKDVPAKQAGLASPWDVEPLDDGHTLAIAVAGLHQIWGYDTKTQTVSALAGTGIEDIQDGAALKANLAQPSGLSQEGGDLFFVDAESSALRVLSGGKVKTLIGTGLFDFGQVDGKYPEALMQHPQGLYADASRIIVADTYNSVLRVYDRKKQTLSTVPLKNADLSEPGDVLEIGNDVYIADTDNHIIKRANLDSGKVETLDLREKK